jgi:hypothetical protein
MRKREYNPLLLFFILLLLNIDIYTNVTAPGRISMAKRGETETMNTVYQNSARQLSLHLLMFPT